MIATSIDASLQTFLIEGAKACVLSDPRRADGAEPGWFEPQHWGGLAQPVTRSGRGAAWFVDGPFGRAVLRHYRRGGLAAKVSADRYVWQGEDKVRSVAEFRLLAQLAAQGHCVPQPLAAAYWRDGWFYRAAILLRRIETERDFLETMRADSFHTPWSQLGRVIARLHRVGAHHSDLNARNILIDHSGALHIIDWDKGRLEAAPGPWCAEVLDRLERSLHKYRGPVSSDSIIDGMRRLRAAHDEALRA